MPDLSADRATIRKPYRAQWYLSVIGAESTVLTGTISAATDTDLTYSTSTGSHTNVAEDMEVVILSSSDVFKGRLRVAIGGTISSTNLPVNEHSAARINVVAGDKLQVLREWRLRDRLVAANSGFDKDSRLDYTDENEEIPPYVNAGGPRVGFAGSGGTKTFSHDSSRSFAVDAGFLSYAWDVRSQNVSGGSISSDSVTVDYDPGTYWISCTATNGANSTSAIKYVPVRVHDENDLPLRITEAQISGTRESGWSATFNVQNAASLDNVPDGTMVIIWGVEYYDETEQSFGAPQSDASNIKFVGWLTRDSSTQTATEQDLQFSAVGTLQRLQQLPGFSQILVREGDASWFTYSSLTTSAAMVYLLRWGTTAQRLIDLYLPTRNYNSPALFIEAATPYEQILELATVGIDGFISDSKISELIIGDDLLLLKDISRAARTTQMTLAPRDIKGLSVDREHTYPISLMEVRGISESTNTSSALPFFSRAPGAPAEAPTQTTVGGLILLAGDPQGDINERAGYYFAKENKTNDGIPAALINLDLRGAYGVFDFYSEWLGLSVGSTYNKRSIDYTSKRSWIESISMALTPNDARVTISAQLETSGEAGVTYIQPAEDSIGLPAYTPPATDIPTFTPITPTNFDQFYVTRFNGTIGLFGQTHLFQISRNFRDSSPTWTETNVGLSASNNVRAWTLDGTALDACWVSTFVGIYYISDLFGSPSANLQFSYDVTIGLTNITLRSNISDTQVVTAALYYRGASRNGTWTTTTTDGGSNWSALSQVSTGTNSSGGQMIPGLEISTKNAAIQYVTGATGGDASSPPINLYRSTDTGATWTSLGNIGSDDAPMIHSLNDATGEVYWYAVADNLTPGQALYRSDTGTTNYVSGLTDGTYTYVPFVNNSFFAAPNNRNRLAMAAVAASSSTVINRRIFVSENQAQTWVESPNPSNMPFTRCYTDGETVYGFTGNGRVFVQSFNNLLAGAQMIEKTGDLSLPGGFQQIQGIIGGGD